MTTPESMSRHEVRAYDARAIASGIPGPVLMENAARGAAELLLSQGVVGPVAIICGKGNNGGDGFVIARHLQAVGKKTEVLLAADPSELTGDAATAFASMKGMGVEPSAIDPQQFDQLLAKLRRCEWIVDALLGTGTQGAIRPPWDRIIETINSARRKVLAVDLPSGLEADTGHPLGPTIRATLTATFVARKRGFDLPESEEFTGPVYVIAIGAGER